MQYSTGRPVQQRLTEVAWVWGKTKKTDHLSEALTVQNHDSKGRKRWKWGRLLILLVESRVVKGLVAANRVIW